MQRLFITTKDRPAEFAILCKSLLHSDMHKYINEVIFLDDNSEDISTMQRIFSSMSYSLLSRGIKSRWVQNRDGRSGINENLDRIKFYKCDFVWYLDSDMIVFKNYFKRCFDAYTYGISKYSGSPLLVSGFDTWLHPHAENFNLHKLCTVNTVGGCSGLFHWKDIDKFLECLSVNNSNKDWDLRLGEIFENILVTTPSVSQHIGILTGLNQVSLAGFPGAWADVEG